MHKPLFFILCIVAMSAIVEATPCGTWWCGQQSDYGYSGGYGGGYGGGCGNGNCGRGNTNNIGNGRGNTNEVHMTG